MEAALDHRDFPGRSQSFPRILLAAVGYIPAAAYCDTVNSVVEAACCMRRNLGEKAVDIGIRQLREEGPEGDNPGNSAEVCSILPVVRTAPTEGHHSRDILQDNR